MSRLDIRPPASPAPLFGGMGADAQNDLQLLDAQFLRGDAPCAPESESGMCGNIDQWNNIGRYISDIAHIQTNTT